MSDLLKKEQLIGSQKVIVGDKYSDLVLRTLGKVYIHTATKFTLLTDLIKESVDKVLQDASFLVIEDYDSELKNREYPGDGKFVYTTDLKNLYITLNDGYVPLIANNDSNIDWGEVGQNVITSAGGKIKGLLEVEALLVNQSEFKQPIKISTTSAPLIVSSEEMVENLNAEYLNGKKWDEFTKRKEEETITGEWTFDAESYFNKKVRIKDSLESNDGFQEGFTGFGWKLDSTTNTLTIDNLIVRKVMQVFELVVNRISATNGALWVSDSAKIKTVDLIIPPAYFINNSTTPKTTYREDKSEKDENGNIITPIIVDINYYMNPRNCHDVDYWDAWFGEDQNLADGYDGVTIDANGLINYIGYQPTVYSGYNDYLQNHDPEDYRYKLDISAIMPVYNSSTGGNDLINLYTNYFRNGNYWLITLEDDYSPFRVNDIIRCQKFTGTSIKYYDALVLKTDMNKIIIRTADQFTDLKSKYDPIKKEWINIENGSGVDSTIRSLTNPAATDGLVRMGNIINPARQGAIYMTSNEEDSPFIDIMSDLNRPDFGVVKKQLTNAGTLKTYRPLKVRIGNLNGIYDPAFGPSQPEGYGLYGENIYIKGHFVQVTGEEEIPISIYRGEWLPNTNYYFNNIVSYNGNTYVYIKIDVLNSTVSPDQDVDNWKIYVKSGEDGQDGQDGIPVIYKGIWSSEKEYFYNKSRDIVKYGSIYYLTKRNSNPNINQIPSNDSEFWEEFGASFQSVATDLLLAQEGTIGNWTFVDGELRSIIKNYNGSSQLILDGGNGSDLGKPNEPNDNYSPEYGNSNRSASIKLNSDNDERNINIFVDGGLPKIKIEGTHNKWEENQSYFNPNGSTANKNETIGWHYNYVLSGTAPYKGGVVTLDVVKKSEIEISQWDLNKTDSSAYIEIRSGIRNVECVFSKNFSNTPRIVHVAIDVVYWTESQEQDGSITTIPNYYTDYINITQDANPNIGPSSSSYKVTASLDSSKLRISNDVNNSVEIGIDSIFCNYPNRACIPATSGYSVKGSLVGLAYVDSFYNDDRYALNFPDRDKYLNSFVGVFGNSNNSTNFSNKTPNYGGMFYKLAVKGLYSESRILTDSVCNCYDTDVFLICSNSNSDQIVVLPPYPQAGLTLLINRNTNKTVTIKSNTREIIPNLGNATYNYNIPQAGDFVLLIYYEDIYGITINKYWKIVKINS